MDRPPPTPSAALAAIGFRATSEIDTSASSGTCAGHCPDGPAFLRWARRADHDAVQCLRRETLALRSFALRGVPRLLTAGIDEAYIVSAQTLLPGTSLAQTTLQNPMRFASRLVRLLAQVHEQEWVHGDVKPANIIVDEHERPALIDWEFASRPGEPSLPGTLGWAPPSAWTGAGRSDPAHDVYSLAVVVWELLARRRAFSGSRDEVLSQQSAFSFPEADLGPLTRTITELFAAARTRTTLSTSARFAAIDEQALTRVLAFNAADAAVQALGVAEPPHVFTWQSRLIDARMLARSICSLYAVDKHGAALVDDPKHSGSATRIGNDATQQRAEPVRPLVLRPLDTAAETTLRQHAGRDPSYMPDEPGAAPLTVGISVVPPAGAFTRTELHRAMSACIGPVRAAMQAVSDDHMAAGGTRTSLVRVLRGMGRRLRKGSSGVVPARDTVVRLCAPLDAQPTVIYRQLVHATTEALAMSTAVRPDALELCDAWSNFGRADAALQIAEHAIAHGSGQPAIARKLRALATLRRSDELSRTIDEALASNTLPATHLEIARARAVVAINQRDPVRAQRLIRACDTGAARESDPALFALSMNTLGNALRLCGRPHSALRAYRSALSISDRHALRHTQIAAERNVLILQWELGRRSGVAERWAELAGSASKWGMSRDAVDAAARGAQYALLLGADDTALSLARVGTQHEAASAAGMARNDLLERAVTWAEDRCERWGSIGPAHASAALIKLIDALRRREFGDAGAAGACAAGEAVREESSRAALRALRLAGQGASPARLAVAALRTAEASEAGSPLTTLVCRELLASLRTRPARTEFLRLLRTRARNDDSMDCVIAAHVIALVWMESLDPIATRWIRTEVDGRGSVRPWGIRRWEWTFARAILDLVAADRREVLCELDDAIANACWLTPYAGKRYRDVAVRCVDAPSLEQRDHASPRKTSRGQPAAKDLAALLDACAESALSLTRADRVVLIIDRGGGSGRVVVRGRISEPAGADIEVCHSMLALADITDGGVVVDDALCDPRLGERPSVKLYRPRSVVVVPIVVAGQRVGYLYAENRSRGRALTGDDRSALVSLAAEYGSGIDTEFLREERVRLTTEVEKARQESARGRGLELLGRRSSEVLHEIRNILTVVSGEAEIQCSRSAIDAEAAEAFRLILQAARDGADVMQRIQNAVRAPDVQDIEIVDAYEVCHEVLLLSRHRLRGGSSCTAQSIRVQLHGTEGTYVRISPAELREVLTNLVGNAIDAMPTGGSLSVQATQVDGSARVVVADTGIGMSAEQAARVFEPFYSTKGSKGTGLGLPIVEGIVKRYGGKIEVESHVGRGTKFVVELPLAQTSVLDVANMRRTSARLEAAS